MLLLVASESLSYKVSYTHLSLVSFPDVHLREEVPLAYCLYRSCSGVLPNRIAERRIRHRIMSKRVSSP